MAGGAARPEELVRWLAQLGPGFPRASAGPRAADTWAFPPQQPPVAPGPGARPSGTMAPPNARQRAGRLAAAVKKQKQLQREALHGWAAAAAQPRSGSPEEEEEEGKMSLLGMPAPAGGDGPGAAEASAKPDMLKQGAREGPVEGPCPPFAFIDPSAPKPAAAATAGPPQSGPGPSAASPGNSSDLANEWLNGDLDDEPPARGWGGGGMQISDGHTVEEYRQGAAGSAGPPARSQEGPRRRVAGSEEEEEEEELDESEDESSEYNADAASDEGEEEEDVSMELESESRSEEEEEPEVDDGFEEADEEEDMEVDGEVPAYPWRDLTAKHLQWHVNEYQALLKKAGMLMEQLDWNLGQAEAGKEVGMGLPAAGHRALLKEAERLLEAAKAKKEQLAALPFEL